jgi:hypothetical protein
LNDSTNATRPQISSELAELAQRIGQAGTKTIDVRAVLHGGNQIDVTLHQRLGIFERPHDGPIDFFFFTFEVAEKRLFRHAFDAVERGHQIVFQSVFVVPLFVVLFVGLVCKRNLKARTQHGFRAHQMLQTRHREFRRVEEFRIRPESNRGAGLPWRYFSARAQLGGFLSVAKRHLVFFAVAFNQYLKLARQCVYHRHADAVQTAGERVIFSREFTARVQARKDDFDAGNLFAFVLVDRHATAIVSDRDGAILI